MNLWMFIYSPNIQCWLSQYHMTTCRITTRFKNCLTKFNQHLFKSLIWRACSVSLPDSGWFNLCFGLIYDTADTAMIELKLLLSVTHKTAVCEQKENNDCLELIWYYSSLAFQVHILYDSPDNCQDSHQLRSWVTQLIVTALVTGDCFRVNWPTLTLRIFFRISLFLTSSILTFSSLSAPCLNTSLTFSKTWIYSQHISEKWSAHFPQ